MDWMYSGRNCPALILLDTTTRYGAIFPARSKGVWRALAEFCVRFSLGLNYLSEVVYVMDSEPATLGLLDMVVMVRQEMGYPTSKKVGKPYHKGRTARVERYIQTVRRQASTLMTSVEDHIHEVLHGLHCLRAWSLVHAVFLLNRFHEHSAIKATAFETVFGRQRNGKLLPFGEFAFGLRKPMKKTGTSVWQGGMWIGKDESDMHVLITPGGQFHTRSIRRCSNPWRADVIMAITMTPWTKAKGSGHVGLLEAPLPVIEERAEGEDPREPILLKTGDIDEEGEAVRDQESYTPTEVGSPPAEPSALVQEPLERLTEVQRKSLLGIRSSLAHLRYQLRLRWTKKEFQRRKGKELHWRRTARPRRRVMTELKVHKEAQSKDCMHHCLQATLKALTIHMVTFVGNKTLIGKWWAKSWKAWTLISMVRGHQMLHLRNFNRLMVRQ